MDAALRALNRFGLGARVGERRSIGNDPRGWLRGQLDGRVPALAADGLPGDDAIADALRGLRAAAGSDPKRRREARRALIALAAAEAGAALQARITSERPFVERLVAFWSNHLCVSAGAKLLVAPLPGHYERSAIRPHVLGRFEDMLLASARHPAMLAYLDNFQSVGPASAGARPRGARRQARGLNENYARELLELHTLGVDGGYAQSDVQELAKILTGWTIAGIAPRNAREGGPLSRGGAIRFAFVAQLHEPGAKTLLGTRYAEAGEREGERAIHALARHPATARFIAGKLVRHFVADDPPAAAVEGIARVFTATEGDLRAVAQALVELPDAWDGATRKFRSPQDWLVAVLRALHAANVNDATMPLLRQLRQPLWSPPSPQGYADTLEAWADPDALMNRAELARSIARTIGARIPDPAVLLETIDVAQQDTTSIMLRDTSTPREERLALALGGPAFQWR